jgi:hypothetical protein
MTCHDPIALTDLRYPVTGSTTLERATGLKIMVLRMVLQKRLKTIGRMIFTVVS